MAAEDVQATSGADVLDVRHSPQCAEQKGAVSSTHEPVGSQRTSRVAWRDEVAGNHQDANLVTAQAPVIQRVDEQPNHDESPCTSTSNPMSADSESVSLLEEKRSNRSESGFSAHYRGTRRHDEHIRICEQCRRHEIDMYEAEIARLAEFDAPVAVQEPEPQTVVQHEAEVTKITTEKYRHWQQIGLENTSVPRGLLFTADGADHGIQRTVDPTRCQGEGARSAASLSSISASAPGEIPFRLVFNSLCLADLVQTITGSELPRFHPVHVRPFKYLLAHELQIRTALEEIHELFKRAKSVDAGARHAQDSEGPETTHDDPVQSLGRDIIPAVQEEQPDVEATLTSPLEANLDSVSDAPPRSSFNALPTVPAVFKCKFMGHTVRDRDLRLLELLVQFMDVEMKDILDVRKQIADRTLQEISFEYLLHLYSPGDLVLSGSSSQPEARRAYRILFVTGGRPHFEPQPAHLAQVHPNNSNPYYSQYERAIKVGGIDVFPEDSVSQGLQGKATKMTPLVLDCFYVDFDGQSYGPLPHRFIIPEFSGRRTIAELDVYPAEFAQDVVNVREILRKRGEDFVKYAQGMHMEYHGWTLPDRTPITRGPEHYAYESQAAKSEALQVDCECIIDQKAALDRFHPTNSDESMGVTGTNKLGFHTGTIARPTDSNPWERFDKPVHESNGTEIYDDSSFDLNRRSAFLRYSTLLTAANDVQDEQLELLPLRLFGYALQHRRWYGLSVLNLTGVKALQTSKTGSAFEDLVLPEKHKKTIQALVSHQVRRFQATGGTKGDDGTAAQVSEGFDLIHGKGRGLVILLHGAPGVGKTSTAESVAIQLGRPLLPITCGDLGAQVASTVESNLEYFLGLGTRWGCVVLLDEADVFLARRVTGDLKRNSLVSVFLRQMEYYSGVLILTTNRVGEFDEAFISRIHMKLYFPPLDVESTLEIWDMNIRRVKENKDLDLKMNAKAIRKFAKEYCMKNMDHPGRQWNGRQIKNAFQTAVALAFWECDAAESAGRHHKKPVLKSTHFEDVANTSLHFDEYMDILYGAVMPNGRRSQGAYLKEAQKGRIRNDDNEPQRSEPTYYPPPRSSSDLQTAMNTRAQASATDPRVAELERQIAVLQGAYSIAASSSRQAQSAPSSDEEEYLEEDSSEGDD